MADKEDIEEIIGDLMVRILPLPILLVDLLLLS